MYELYFAVVMLSPAALLVIGLMWRISPPPYQSRGLAYSTELTRRNPDAWTAAHRHCARLWTRIGSISGVVSVILMVLFKENYASFWVWIIVGQMVLFCVSVFMVDLLLKHTFEEEDH